MLNFLITFRALITESPSELYEGYPDSTPSLINLKVVKIIYFLDVWLLIESIQVN